MSILETPSKTEINAWLGDGNEGQATTALLDVLRGVRKTTPPVERWLCHDQNICLQVLDEVTSALNMGGHFEGSWSLYVQEMLKLHDASLATAEATKQARTGSLLAPELRFQLATMTSSSVKGPATEDTSSVSWLTTADGRKSTYDMMPMQYVVPGNLSPPKSVQRFEQSAATKATGVKTVTTMPSTSMQISTNTPEMLGGETPTVSQVAAMSSAYAALFGSLHMVEKFANAEYEHLIQDHWLAAWTGAGPPRELEGNPLREQVEGLATFYNTSSYPSGCRNLFTLGVCTEVTWGKLMPCVNAVLAKCALPALTTYLADHAVCAHDSSSVDPEFDTRICDFPAVRVAEGGMVDSSSSAQSLGALQKSNPGKTLRMVISTSEDCEDRLTCAHDALKQLFSHEEKSLHMQASRPVPQVFGTAWAIVKDHLQPIPGTQYGVHAKLRTTTVTNDLYGVAGGTHVEVLLLSFDAPLSLLKTASVSAKSMRAMGVYANDAASTPVSLLVGTWMNATRTATIVVEEIA
ncbi:hypothetical protein T492DRAFT_838666 [Pavlovales sp. CCMP2436]|nr:hypothetical protein T492DRAFT_838666 [Pavlovales sp. CCMP2436]